MRDPQAKPEPLKVKESEVKPVELPDKGTQHGPEGKREETEQDVTVDTRDRPEKRRSLRERQKEEKIMRAQIKKMTQRMARPLRHRDMQLIVNQVSVAFRPTLTKIQDDLDKLAYLPDYINDEMQKCGLVGTGLNISIAGFESWFDDLKAKLDAVDTSSDGEGEPVKEQQEDVGSPVTEETQ
jgi:hypothetical protein